jgi:hypothetical protein
MKNQKGSAVIWAILILVVIVIAGAAYWYGTQTSVAPMTSAPEIPSTQQTIVEPTQTQGANAPQTSVQSNETTQSQNSTSEQTSSPQVALSASPTSGTRGQPITFSTSYGGQTGTAYYVDFGDNSLGWFACGQTVPNEQVNETCLPATFQHTYAGSGAYTYTVTLHRYNGSFNNSPIVGTATVTVSGTDTAVSPTCTLTASPSTAGVGQPITISWTAQNANAEGPAGYGAWVGLGGDGSILEEMGNGPTSFSGSQTVTAEGSGSQTLGLEINGAGGSGEGSCSVVITVTGN